MRIVIGRYATLAEIDAGWDLVRIVSFNEWLDAIDESNAEPST